MHAPLDGAVPSRAFLAGPNVESALRVLEGRRAFEADACEGLVAHLSAERPGVLFAPALLDAAVDESGATVLGPHTPLPAGYAYRRCF